MIAPSGRSATRIFGELTRDELAGFIEGAWLSRAGPRAVATWMRDRGTSEDAGSPVGKPGSEGTVDRSPGANRR